MQPKKSRAIFCAVLFLTLLFHTQTVLSQWVEQTSGTTYDLYAVYFINSSSGFIGSNSNSPLFFGGEIIRTTNGGGNWVHVLSDHLFVKDIYFINLTTGFAVGTLYAMSTRIYKTTDSGLTWQDISPMNIQSGLLNIQFIDVNTAFAGGTRGVFKSTDAGSNWTVIFNLASNHLSWGKVYFFDANTGIYTGDTGKVHRTTNAGVDWTAIPINTSRLLRDVNRIDNNKCIIVGDTVILSSDDRGASWLNILPPSNKSFFSVQFVNQLTGYMTGYHNVWKSTNSGLIWFPIQTNPSNYYFAAYFTDLNTGYVVGDTGIVYKTTTGGVIGIPPISAEIPKTYLLFQNFPNPFNPITSIRFAVPKAAFVKLSVFDMLGREVEVLVNENISPATYEVNWNAGKHSSGVYFYRLSTADFQQVKKMSVIK